MEIKLPYCSTIKYSYPAPERRGNHSSADQGVEKPSRKATADVVGDYHSPLEGESHSAKRMWWGAYHSPLEGESHSAKRMWWGAYHSPLEGESHSAIADVVGGSTGRQK